MKNVLVITASLNGASGNSVKLAKQFIEKLNAKNEHIVENLDLANEDLPHLSQSEMAAWGVDEEARNEQEATLASISDGYISRIKQADLIVLALPMYNFDSPSVVKAFFDRLARAGVTFSYSENGPIGLIEGKKAVVIFARGGAYQGTPMDTQTPYVKNFLGFIGIKDVEVTYAEGLAMGEESAKAALSKINEEFLELIEKL
ncbi:FMN-dependent NADH-azoreductase [Glaciecola sp. KUL10]|uniref:FMN-dependent NADH-azoreductase n=1 Tax=Glaciecola sp. (strain KUL10) TaxID=2161813 RepID=UPI000D783069|nr:NAD(P)H-dependent oxidoreductase [Glaciecola sp. KUL10]GBL02820.1 (acyl-carrier-protein) phosphodiesterase [Glaciecola sp. KUL10]